MIASIALTSRRRERSCASRPSSCAPSSESRSSSSPLGVVEILANPRKELVHRVAHALRERAALDAAPCAARVTSQGIESDHVEQLVCLLRKHRAKRGEPLESALEQLLLLAHALHH